jgi:hypothetical protein
MKDPSGGNAASKAAANVAANVAANAAADGAANTAIYSLRMSIVKLFGAHYVDGMIRRTRSLEDIERRHTRDVLAGRSYLEALAVFEALWRHAVLLNPRFPGDWRGDIAADLEIARALNGLPPAA